MAKEKFERTKPHVNVGHDRSRGPWQDDADGGDCHGAVQKFGGEAKVV